MLVEHYEDKSTWGEGPWQDEPDKAQWGDPKSGVPCLIVRGPVGALCGYVGVHDDHPYFRRNYDELENIDVHGGLTFSDVCQAGGKICHKSDDGKVTWWIGFDCAHGGDYAPKHGQYRHDPEMKATAEKYKFDKLFEQKPYQTYRDMAYVEGQIQQLALQLKKKNR